MFFIATTLILTVIEYLELLIDFGLRGGVADRFL